MVSSKQTKTSALQELRLANVADIASAIVTDDDEADTANDALINRLNCIVPLGYGFVNGLAALQP